MPSLDDYRWLTDAGAAAELDQLMASLDVGRASPLATVAQLRKRHSAERAHLLVELAELRRRAVERFPLAARMFFTARGLEQATDAHVAAYKASRIAARLPAGANVADLCCGIGGDLLGLLDQGLRCWGLDRDEVIAMLARANVQACRGHAAPTSPETSVRCEDVEARAEPSAGLGDAAAWHIDPDRRPAGHRTTRVELHEPRPEAIDRLRGLCPHGAVKLAPAAEVPTSWSAEAELEWISRRGECRQQVAWFGSLATAAGERRATIVRTASKEQRDSPVDSVPELSRVVWTIGGRAGVFDHVGPLGRYLYEPDAAVLAAQLEGVLAESWGLHRVAPGIGYLSGDNLVECPALAGFELLELLPLDRRRLAAAVRARGAGIVEVKKRGVECDPLELARHLKGRGERQLTVLVTRSEGKVVAILARRLGRTGECPLKSP